MEAEVLDGCPSHFLIKLPCSRARRTVVVHPSRFLIRLPPDLLKSFFLADMTLYVWRREATGAQRSPNTERSTTYKQSSVPRFGLFSLLDKTQLFGIIVQIETHLFIFLASSHRGPWWMGDFYRKGNRP